MAYRIDDLPDGLEIVIPIEADWRRVLPATVFFAGWALAELYGIREVVNPSRGTTVHAFMVLWLVMWTCGGLCSLLQYAWNTVGEERVRVTATRVSIKRSLLGIGPTSAYPTERITGLRVVNPPTPAWRRREVVPFQFASEGRIAFDSPRGLVRFGRSLDQRAAREIVERINRFGNLSRGI